MLCIGQTSADHRQNISDISVNVGDVGGDVGEKSVNDGDVKASVLRMITDNKRASTAGARREQWPHEMQITPRA